MTSNEKIAVFQPPLFAELESALDQTLKSYWWSYGPKCLQLESVFCGSRGGWSLAVSSCTTALYLLGSWLAKETSGDGEIITPATTFVSTAMAFEASGLRARIADVDPDSLLMTTKDAEMRLTKRTCAVVVVHLYGQEVNLEPWRSFCDAHDLWLIEDCAHRIGSPGAVTSADFSCYSFNSVKEAPAGEGGLLWGRNPDAENFCRLRSYLGMNVDTWQRSSNTVHSPYGFTKDIGLKLRFNDLGASMVLACLPKLRQWSNFRRTVFSQYNQMLMNNESLTPLARVSGNDSYLMYVTSSKHNKRELMRKKMAEFGVSTSVHYPSLSRHPIWSSDACHVAESAEDRIMTLPCHSNMSQEQVNRVATALQHLK